MVGDWVVTASGSSYWRLIDFQGVLRRGVMVAEEGSIKCINRNIHRKICKDKMRFFKYLSNFPYYLKTHFVYRNFLHVHFGINGKVI